MKIPISYKYSGIYIILNSETGKMYVGSCCSSIYARLHIHRFNLRRGTHHSKHLQASWDKYGETAFSCSTLKVCSPEDCVIQEQHYIDLYDSANPRCGYNIHPNARNPLGVKRSQYTKDKLSRIANSRSESHKQEIKAKMLKSMDTDEYRQKISQTHKSKVLSEETRKKISQSVLAKVASYREKLSAAHKGKRLSEEHKQKIRDGNKGKKLSKETREKMSLAHSNRSPEYRARLSAGIRAALVRKKAALGIPIIL